MNHDYKLKWAHQSKSISIPSRLAWEAVQFKELLQKSLDSQTSCQKARNWTKNKKKRKKSPQSRRVGLLYHSHKYWIEAIMQRWKRKSRQRLQAMKTRAAYRKWQLCSMLNWAMIRLLSCGICTRSRCWMSPKSAIKVQVVLWRKMRKMTMKTEMQTKPMPICFMREKMVTKSWKQRWLKRRNNSKLL